jgi:tetratricopeptide (TPR) repeat protein
VKAEIAKFQKVDAQNLAQSKNWDVLKRYVRSPFSRFNFDMAVAYLVQIHHLPKPFRRIGWNRLDAALAIYPNSRDARLLEAWYRFNQNDPGGAAKVAEKILAGDPNDSNVWLGLGFFRAKAGDKQGAVAAFEKVIELYPGYPRRAIVEAMCSELKSKGKPIKSASAAK